MGAKLNKTFLMGNLTRDPELRHLPNGTAVTDLGLALNRTYQTKDGERREEVTYLDVAVWDRAAENCCQYLKRGSSVFVEGFLKLDSWDDKTTGEKRSKIKVQAERVQFLDGKPSDDGEAPQRRDTGKWGGPNRNGNNGHQAQPQRGSGDTPTNGRFLFKWIKDRNESGLLERFNAWGQSNRLSKRMTEWPDTAAVMAYDEYEAGRI